MLRIMLVSEVSCLVSTRTGADLTNAVALFYPERALVLLLVVLERNRVVENRFVELALRVVAAST